MIGTITAGIVTPPRWILAFRYRAETPLVNLLALGRYKHVAAFGCLDADAEMWVWYDVRLAGTDVFVTRGRDATRHVMGAWADGADLVGIVPRPRPPGGFPLAGWCVPAMRRLIGLPGGALRPDALYRDCLRHGGQIIDGEERPPAVCHAGT